MSEIFGFVNRVFDALKVWQKRDRRIPLPYNQVRIADFNWQKLACEVICKIVLDEDVKPSINEFLSRVDLGEPYCLECSTPLTTLHGDWITYGAQIGYKCERCGVEMRGDRSVLLRAVKGQVRETFDECWERYQLEISKLTKGKQRKYRSRTYQD